MILLYLKCHLSGSNSVVECQLLPTPFVFCHLDHVLSPLLSAKMRLAGEIFCRESTSSNASKLAAAGRCFQSPAMPKATTTGTPSPTAATMSSGTRAALAVV